MNKTHTTLTEVRSTCAVGFDAHCWIEHNGKVIDYADELLKAISEYGTDDIVRKEFPKSLQAQLMPECIGMWKKNRNSRPRMLKMMLEIPGFCQTKALRYKARHPEAIVKIGSLGFRQPNGKDIFWEYG